MDINAFKALIGKEIGVKLDADVVVKATVATVDALKEIECDVDVRKEPFSVVLEGPLNQRIPSGMFEISGDGIPDGSEIFIDPLADLNPEDDNLPYESVFA